MDSIQESQNFISADSKTAIDTFGNRFSVDGEVFHIALDEQSVIIKRFEICAESAQVKAYHEKGWTYVDYLRKPENIVLDGIKFLLDYEDEARRFLAKAHRCSPQDITHKAVVSHLAARLSAIEQQYTCAKSYTDLNGLQHAMSEIGQILTCTDAQ